MHLKESMTLNNDKMMAPKFGMDSEYGKDMLNFSQMSGADDKIIEKYN